MTNKKNLHMIDIMKKIFIASSTFFSGFITLTPIAYAETLINCDNPASQFNTICKLTGSQFGSAFGQIITFAFILAIMIALGFLIWGGIKWVTSGGEKAGVEEARNHVIAAVVGLIIVFLSYFIINLIVFFFTGQSLNTIKIPQLSITP